MKEWLKKNKWKILIPLLALAVLAAAFWYGGNVPGVRGWRPKRRPLITAKTSEAPWDNPTQE